MLTRKIYALCYSKLPFIYTRETNCQGFVGGMGEDPGPTAAFAVHGDCAGHSEDCIWGIVWGMTDDATEYTFCGATERSSLVDTLFLTLLVPPIASE